MTLLRFSGLVSKASGILFGSTISRNRYGATIRNNIPPRNPDTPFQQATRVKFQTAVKRWGNLFDAERNSWNEAAQFINFTDFAGYIYHPTGFNYFLSCNLNRFACSLPLITAPVLSLPVPVQFPCTITSILFPFPHYLLEFNGYSTAALFTYKLSASGLISKGKSTYLSHFRDIAVIPTGVFNLFNFTAAWQSVYGNFISGKQIQVCLKICGNSSGVVQSVQYLKFITL